jgi:hypothetical protein
MLRGVMVGFRRVDSEPLLHRPVETALLFWRAPERLESRVGGVVPVKLLLDQTARYLRRLSIKRV